MLTSGQRKALSATHLRGDTEMISPDLEPKITPLHERMRYFMVVVFLLPFPVAVLLGLAILLIEPTADQFEDIDVWCEQYHPDHSGCVGWVIWNYSYSFNV